MTIAYGIMTVIAVVLLIGYCLMARPREGWMLFLFACVPVVNIGYFMLSLSQTVDFALLANKVAYLGSVFLPLCMFMTVLRLCGFSSRRWMTPVLLGLALLMFSFVATTGWLPWYYREVSLEMVDGAAKLVKEYGPLHPTYLLYLTGYFAAMVTVVVRSLRQGRFASHKHAVLMTVIVFGNIAFWLVEKFVPWNFEFLSVSYLFSEVLLLGLHWLAQDTIVPAAPVTPMEILLARLPKGVTLHPREREILELVLENAKRKDIATQLSLSENTVKTYTRNLYRKLGISSREELFALLP